MIEAPPGSGPHALANPVLVNPILTRAFDTWTADLGAWQRPRPHGKPA